MNVKEKNDKLLELWRKSKELKFGAWLNKQEDKCEFCESNCGNAWCPVNKGEENTDEE